MKPSLIILFLTILLLCGVLLRAESNNREANIKKREELKTVEIKKEMALLPNIILF